MKTVKKILMIPLLTILGIIIASAYGAIHNQLSYTVSREYFTRFKFEQFMILDFPERLGASIVGIMASWWMGLIIGLILGLVALIQRDASAMLRSTIESYAVVLGVALFTGLIGLGYGAIYLSKLPAYEFSDWYIPDGLMNPAAFISAGSMHNFGYLGGLIGLFAGIWWQMRFRRKGSTTENQ